MKTLAFFLAALTLPAIALSQDYPYDGPEDAPPADKSGLPTESSNTKSPSAPGSGGQPSLFRVGVKGGAEYAIFQTYGASTLSGVGFGGLFSLGWDLPYQPVFVELEAGFKKLFPSSDTSLLVMPLRFGMFRRMRIGAQSLFKFGVVPSLDLRIQDDASGGSEASVVPSLTLAVVWEFGGFLIQPETTIYRIRASDTRISFGTLVGYRF